MITRSEKGIPRQKWLAPELWKEVEKALPIVSTDVLFEAPDGRILFGYRIIEPYRNVWAFVGGRLLLRETLRGAVKRISAEYGLSYQDLHLVGVYTPHFPTRSSVTIAVAAVGASGENLTPGGEFSRLTWMSSAPKNTGLAYRSMLSKWKEEKRSKEALDFNRII